MVLEKIAKKKSAFVEQSIINDKVIKDLALAMIGLNDPYTAEHIEEVAEIVGQIGLQMGLSAFEIERLALAGFLHDIGKQAIPSSILSKPAKLSDEEFALVKTHVNIGVQLLEYANVSSDIVRIVAEHHERIDGSGYPRGLKGDEISLSGQIIGIADVISALTSKRTYRVAATSQEVIEILRGGAAGEFAPAVIDAAIKCL